MKGEIMAKELIPRYIVRMDGNYMQWSGNGRRIPRATEANLEEFVMNYAKSLRPGGENEHISNKLGYIPYPNKAFLMLNGSNIVVASWEAGQFQKYD
jgi:hypothetical protein